MANAKLWGLTLLERNIRELEKLGVREVIIEARAGEDPSKQFCLDLPSSMKVTLKHTSRETPFSDLTELLHDSKELLLVIEGHALNYRRLMRTLLASESPIGVFPRSGSSRAAAAVVDHSNMSLFTESKTDDLTTTLLDAMKLGKLSQMDLNDFNPYIDNLRRRISPYLLAVKSNIDLEEADNLLRLTVHKGVLEFVAKYIHPPLEFGAVRWLTCTPITPNQITIAWLILGALVIPLFAKGYLLTAAVLAALCGVMDGIDGKLARLTLQYSKVGDLLDHIGGTLYDAIWYVAIGWYFIVTDPRPSAEMYATILFFAYLVERAVPGIFRKLHGSEIYDYEDIDIFVRFVGSRMNNNIWLFMLGTLFGLAEETFYFISIWMLATATWHTLRLIYVTLKTKTNKPALAN